MLKKRIIPCLDIKNGRVVKGINFVDLVDAGDPPNKLKYIMIMVQMKFVFWILQPHMKIEILY